MRKFAIIFLIFAFTMPVYAAQTQSEAIQQAIMKNMTPQQKEAYLKKQETEKKIAAEKEERRAELLRLKQADFAQAKINYCNSVKQELKKAGGDFNGVYYDYMSGQCVVPETPYSPAMVNIYTNKGTYGTGYIYY